MLQAGMLGMMICNSEVCFRQFKCMMHTITFITVIMYMLFGEAP